MLRNAPVFNKLIADRLPDDDDLASQPTKSRLENAVTAGDLLAMTDWFVDRFVETFAKEPTEITLDGPPTKRHSEAARTSGQRPIRAARV